MTDDEPIEMNHRIFTQTGPPRPGLLLWQELLAQHEEMAEELDRLRAEQKP